MDRDFILNQIPVNRFSLRISFQIIMSNICIIKNGWVFILEKE